MEELLKKLLAAEVLSEETKTELETAFKAQLSEATEVARAAATATVTAELNEQWISERETLIEALDAKVSEVLTEEMSELRTDIERFRDLEAEYAEKLVESKSEMGVQLKSDLSILVEKLDTFLEIRLAAEVEELREDVATVKKNLFGKKVFEAFVSEFKKHYASDDDSIEAKLTETEQRLEDTMSALETTEKKVAQMERSKKLQETLAPLSGRTKEVMEAILKNVDTQMLEDAYATYIGRVLKETSIKEEKTSEKEDTTVLAEGTKVEKVSGVAKSGDNKDLIVEHKKHDDLTNAIPALSNEEKLRLQRIAGISR